MAGCIPINSLFPLSPALGVLKDFSEKDKKCQSVEPKQEPLLMVTLGVTSGEAGPDALSEDRAL